MTTPLFRLLAAASLGLLLIGTTACDKASPTPEKASSALLAGHWELTYTTGGLAGGTQPADPSRKQAIVFTSAGQSSILLNGTVISSSPFTLTQAPAITGRAETFVTYATGSTISSFINKLLTNELVLTENVYDGFDLHYTRR